MGLIENILARPTWRQKLWQWWYPYFTNKVRHRGIDFLNYAFETEPAMAITLSAEDEVNRGNIQLYHHVVSPVKLGGLKVLEVSCGHGGGASYLTRTFLPAQYVALDLNPRGIEYCRTKHTVPGLEFIQGDAMNLPFVDQTFDVVINVEASHCYPDFKKFVQEVARVLKPKGSFVHADLRYPSGMDEWLGALFSHPQLRVSQMRLINPEVVRGMVLNTPKYEAMIKQCFPKYLHRLGMDFAGVEGSRLHRDAVSGEMSYRSFHLTKRV
jgi:ubiquinone/menaquinone biosynthesis C-methylase UbiE